ncbi:glycosyltransferase family 2 protein [Roseibacterium sp. KMU-115]|uniref:Glycosyltransferase family 2 protein n=2 Tax=Roseicyclus persicicus TaxID=2650661 RepID=A0A7X6GWB7_9RHOB|nr:glycosyltransferase family 2 protein [Roseibacterium persicicum]
MMKDEAPFLLEWFAHHLAVGFTDILVYTNDCSDGTDDMLIRLEELGLGYHRRNVIPEGIKPQPSALAHAQAEPLVGAADWVLVFDADEFLCINHPSGNLEGMLDDTVARGANGVVITWRIFGSGGVIDWSRAPVTEQYTRAAPPLWNKGWGVKTLFKFDPDHWKLGIHRPSIKNKWLETGFPDEVQWLNGSGQPMEDYFKFRGWRSIRRTVGYDWAQMNHYAVKSIDSYAVRKFRGNVNNKADKYNADYWSLQDRNEVEDRSILRHAPARARIMAELLTDPVLNRLHHAALERVEARLAQFRDTDAYRALRDGLIEASKVPITKVEAKPPKARDPEKIAALMTEVEKKAQGRADKAPRAAEEAGGDPYVDGPIDLSGDLACDWVPNHELPVPADPRVFRPEVLNAIVAGRFERRHARNIAGYAAGCTRLLDIGAGIGFVAMRLVQVEAGTSALVQDGRAALLGLGRDIARRAGLGAGPRLGWSDGPPAALIAQVRPDALRLSRADDLPPAALAALELGPVRRVILPFATRAEAGALRAAYAPVLADLGFAEDAEREGSGSLQFDRKDG